MRTLCELVSIRQVPGTRNFRLYAKYKKPRSGQIAYWRFEVTDFAPYFFLDRDGTKHFNTLLASVPELHGFVHSIRDSEFTNWYDEPLKRIETVRSTYVRMFKKLLWGKQHHELQDENHWVKLQQENPLAGQTQETDFDVYQADVRYPTAFMVSKGIVRHFTVPDNLVGLNDVDVPHKLISAASFSREFENHQFPIGWGDIEIVTDDEDTFPDASEAKFPVVSCALATTNGWRDWPKEVVVYTSLDVPRDKTYTHTVYNVPLRYRKFKNEKALLRGIFKFCEDKEVILWWNEDFDVPYLLNRARRFKIDSSALRYAIQIMDAMKCYMYTFKQHYGMALKWSMIRIKQFRPESAHLLPEISDAYLEFRSKQSGGDIKEMVENKQWGHLILYNASDVLDMVAQRFAAGYDSVYETYRWLGLSKPEDATVSFNKKTGRVTYNHAAKLAPSFLTFCSLNKVAVPSARTPPPKKKDDEKDEGGFVGESKTGKIWRNVTVADISRYYINIIISELVSPERQSLDIDPKSVPWLFDRLPDGRVLDKPGLALVVFADYLRQGRDQAEAELQKATTPEDRAHYKKLVRTLKDITSGLWGYVAYPKSAIFRQWAKERILEVSRHFIIKLGERLEEHGYILLASDTDSYMIANKEGTFVDPYEIHKLVNEIMAELSEEKGYAEPLTAKPEKIASFAIFSKKKHYSMRLIWEDPKIDPDTWKGTREELIQQGMLAEPKLLIKGMAAIRSDSTRFASGLQTSLLQYIYDLAEKHDADEGIIMPIVEKWVRERTKELKAIMASGDMAAVERLAKPQSFRKPLEEYMRSSMKNIALGAMRWNQRFPDEAFTPGTKGFYFPCRGKRKLTFINIHRLDIDDFDDIDIPKIVRMNVSDRVFSILRQFGYSEDRLYQIAVGDKRARRRSSF